MSVVQESTLSCLLYLVYVLDLPTLYHTLRPTVEQQENCPQPSPTAFVDDMVVMVKLDKPGSNQQKLEQSFNIIKDYMSVNCLHLNPDKPTLLIISKNPDRKNQFSLPTDTETVYPSSHHKYLGIQISDTLKLIYHIMDSKESLTRQLIT